MSCLVSCVPQPREGGTVNSTCGLKAHGSWTLLENTEVVFMPDLHFMS